MIQITRLPGSSSYRLLCEVRLPAPINQVFAFFADASQLERLTPRWLKFSVLTPSPLEMTEGTLIDYRLRVHGVPLRWQSRISLWEPPFRFADEQLNGPYRRWYHLHSFSEKDGGTLCRDEVEYSFIGGAILHSLFVKRDLYKIFAFRTQALQKIFSNHRISALTNSTRVSIDV